MKGITAVLALLVAITAVNLLCAPLSLAADRWGLIDENDDSSFYYDKDSLMKHDAGKIQVRTRAIYTMEGKDAALKVLKSYKNMDKLYESQYLYDLDCVEKRSHLLDVQHLNEQGQILKSTNLGGATPWEEILPDTRLAYVFDEVCPQ